MSNIQHGMSNVQVWGTSGFSHKDTKVTKGLDLGIAVWSAVACHRFHYR